MTAESTTLLHLADGAPLIASIEQWCDARGVTSGWVRAIGRVRQVELTEAGTVRVVSAKAEATLCSFDASIAQLGGRPTLRAAVVLSVDTDGVRSVVAGELAEAECVDVELVVSPGANAATRAMVGGEPVLRAGDAPATAAAAAASRPAPAVKPEPKPAPKPAPAPAPKPAPRPAVKPEPKPEPAPRPSPTARPASGPAPSPAPASAWAKVMDVSDEVQAGADDDELDVDTDDLERGDTLLHPTLDRCTVVKVEGDDAIRVRVPNGSVRKLMLRPFRLLRTDQAGVYRIEKKK